MGLESLRLLELKVHNFLARYEQVQKEKEKLVLRLQEKERAYEELANLVKHYEQERQEIRERLEHILGCFNGLDL